MHPSNVSIPIRLSTNDTPHWYHFAMMNATTPNAHHNLPAKWPWRRWTVAIVVIRRIHHQLPLIWEIQGRVTKKHDHVQGGLPHHLQNFRLVRNEQNSPEKGRLGNIHQLQRNHPWAYASQTPSLEDVDTPVASAERCRRRWEHVGLFHLRHLVLGRTRTVSDCNPPVDC